MTIFLLQQDDPMGRDTLPDGRMDGWTDGWMNGRTHSNIQFPAGIPDFHGSCRPGTQTRMVRW